MRAVVTEDYGSMATLAELPTPEAGPGEVRLRVRSSSLNGFDLALAGGFFRGIMEHSFPVVLGRDFAGTVDQVGAGVTAFAPGDEVFGVVLTQPLHAGGFAEYLVVPEDHSIARIPAGVDHATAGAIGLAGSAAVAALERIAAQAGETVLVAGATGGVGAVAIQHLAAAGATVIATAAAGAEAEHVRALGAHHIVDRAGDVVAQARAVAPGGVDAVLHLAGDPEALAGALRSGGRLASLLMIDPAAFAGRDVTASPVVASPTRPLLERLAAQVASGALRIPIQRAYRLDDVPRAIGDFAAGTLGKLAITLD